jgi:hypothetical protein
MFSCKEPIVQFEEPQPADVKSLLKIPEKLYGNYSNENDSIKLIISSSLIIKKFAVSDSIGYYFNDTIFNLETDQIKKFRGHYYINDLLSNNNWDVHKIKLRSGFLTIEGISTEEEISNLEQITETKNDTTKTFVVKPTKKQFKVFLKKNGFNSGEVFIKN